MFIRLAVAFILASLLLACGSSNNQTKVTEKVEPDDTAANEQTVAVAVNQLGYTPKQTKIAVVGQTDLTEFSVVDSDSNEVLFTNSLTDATVWDPAGTNAFKIADFSEFTQIGKFKVVVGELSRSTEFEIHDAVYDELHSAVLKSYFYNRASTAVEMPYTQTHVRAAGHPDLQVKVHDSAASSQRPTGTRIAAAKGWYDAGDYGKYIVNSGITMFTLLSAFAHFPDVYTSLDIGIPESADGIPDILNEIRWNLDWMLTMQDVDGGVYHKLTTLGWPGIEMPSEDQRERYVIGKSTAATLDFAATMALAYRVYSEQYVSQQDQLEWLEAAESAWRWALANENAEYVQPSDVSSGEYGDNNFSDEFAWASAELYLATGKPTYHDYFMAHQPSYAIPSWQNVSALPLVSLVNHGEAQLSQERYQHLKAQLLSMADEFAEDYKNSPFATLMTNGDFVWGSNSVALNKSMILIQAYRITNETRYKTAALSSLSYVLGRNPTGYSFVTGFGAKPAQNPHHRISEADNIAAPIPGMVVGGPQPGKQDNCNYVAATPAETYVDDWCSYATNEVAINWNAPMLYLLAFVVSEY